jgi:hypothetical protein
MTGCIIIIIICFTQPANVMYIIYIHTYIYTSYPTRLYINNILQSEYLKLNNIIILLTALHHYPQYRYARCWIEANDLDAAHNASHCM